MISKGKKDRAIKKASGHLSLGLERQKLYYTGESSSSYFSFIALVM